MNRSRTGGWDIWLQNDRVAVHIIDSWPGQALKVAARPRLKTNRWTHVAFTSHVAQGLKIYYDGVLQAMDTESNGLKPESNISTSVPFKIGKRRPLGPRAGRASRRRPPLFAAGFGKRSRRPGRARRRPASPRTAQR